jgi:hypothetical protein
VGDSKHVAPKEENENDNNIHSFFGEKSPEPSALPASWSLENGGSVWTEGLQTCCPKRLNPQDTRSPVSVAMVL